MSTLEQAAQSLRGVSDHAETRVATRSDTPPDRGAIRALWWESHPVEAPHVREGSYARYHADTGLLLIAANGVLKTAVRLSDRPREEKRIVREQVEEEIRA